MPYSRSMSSWAMPSPRWMAAWASSRSAASAAEIGSVSKGGVGEGTGNWVGEDFQQMGHGRQLAGVELVEHLMGVFFHSS